MQCKRCWSIAIAVLILLTAATGYASAQAATPSSTATPTPLPSPPPTSAADPDVQIPAGWKRIEDDRLGYSLAVPFSWLTFDLHSGALEPHRRPAWRKNRDGFPARISRQPGKAKTSASSPSNLT